MTSAGMPESGAQCAWLVHTDPRRPEVVDVRWGIVTGHDGLNVSVRDETVGDIVWVHHRAVQYVPGHEPTQPHGETRA